MSASAPLCSMAACACGSAPGRTAMCVSSRGRQWAWDSSLKHGAHKLDAFPTPAPLSDRRSLTAGGSVPRRGIPPDDPARSEPAPNIVPGRRSPTQTAGQKRAAAGIPPTTPRSQPVSGSASAVNKLSRFCHCREHRCLAPVFGPREQFAFVWGCRVPGRLFGGAAKWLVPDGVLTPVRATRRTGELRLAGEARRNRGTLRRCAS